MRTEVDRITSLMRQTYGETPYYGPSLDVVLRDVNGETAAWRPVGSCHTIWEIVIHLAAELRYAVELINGTAGPWVDGQTTWPPVEDVSEAAWDLVREDLRRAHQDLLEVVNSMDDSDLHRRADGIGLSFYVLLHGVVQHNVYHAGQIRLLSRQATSLAPAQPGRPGRGQSS